MTGGRSNTLSLEDSKDFKIVLFLPGLFIFVAFFLNNRTLEKNFEGNWDNYLGDGKIWYSFHK